MMNLSKEAFSYRPVCVEYKRPFTIELLPLRFLDISQLKVHLVGLF